jgi:predicted nucleic acid-binding protein
LSRFVVDNSVTMGWCFADEANAYTDEILQRFTLEKAIVPALWSLEVSNVLLVGERRKRLTQADTEQFLQLLRSLPIDVDEETPHRAFEQIIALGRQQTLSAYDAAYLELAMRTGIPLATQDKELRRAAPIVGVTLL